MNKTFRNVLSIGLCAAIALAPGAALARGPHNSPPPPSTLKHL